MYYVGQQDIEIHPLPIYSDIVLDFLNDLSKECRKDLEAKRYPDILTFAFWCRKANLIRLKEKHQVDNERIGKGLVFHIAPSNVPINFAFTLAFGLLSGNANVIRVSEKPFEQIQIICRIINTLLERKEYTLIKKQIQIIFYKHDSEWNDYYSKKCDMRIIWGGDNTICKIRKSPLKYRATEITFADRYSFAIFDEDKINMLSEKELRELAEKFYNDTYLMDQNACSSPHLIFWKNDGEKKQGRMRFWAALGSVVKSKYDLTEKKVMDKYTILCEIAAKNLNLELVYEYGNMLYVVDIHELPQNLEDIRGKFGLFFETKLPEWEILGKLLSEKTQTCVTYGIDRQKLIQEIFYYGMQGIDRIVSVGKAMDIGVYWDGHDIINELSRKIIVEG